MFSTIVMTFLVHECYGSPKISIKFVKIRQNSLKFTPEKRYDKVLNEEFKKKLFCKMKNVITRFSTFNNLITNATFNVGTLKVRLVCQSSSTSPTNSSRHTSSSIIIVGMFKINQNID
jgi:phosphoketolase